MVSYKRLNRIDTSINGIFLANRSDFSVASAYDHWLSSDETEKKDCLLFEKDRQQYVVSHCLVRSVLSLYLELPPQDLTFLKTTDGKPYLANDHPLHFNLSHSHEWVVLAVSQACEVGVDIECIDEHHLARCHNVLSIAKNFLHETEYRHLKTLRGKQLLKYFTHLWTLKESYLKGKGVGLRETPSTFTFVQKDGVTTIEGSDQNDWIFFSFDMISNYVLSLAIRSRENIDQTKSHIQCYRVIPGNKSIKRVPLSPVILLDHNWSAVQAGH